MANDPDALISLDGVTKVFVTDEVETHALAGIHLHIKKGEALSLQYHDRKDEFLYVVTGAIEMELGGPDGALTKHRMTEGDTLHITPGTRHRMTAVDDTDIFEVSTPELDDVVRLEDRYGRAGT